MPTLGSWPRCWAAMTRLKRHLRAALATATAFGWTYHRATTLFALAQARHRRLGALDEEGRSWLSESSELCRAYGFQNWIAQIDDLAASQPAHRAAALIRAPLADVTRG